MEDVNFRYLLIYSQANPIISEYLTVTVSTSLVAIIFHPCLSYGFGAVAILLMHLASPVSPFIYAFLITQYFKRHYIKYIDLNNSISLC